MRLPFLIVLVLGVSLVAGCGPAMNSASRGVTGSVAERYKVPLRQFVTVEEDSFERRVKFLGIENIHAQDQYNIGANKYYLRSSVDKETGDIIHQLYVTDYYNDDWRFWNRARDEDANALEFISIDRDVAMCGRHTDCSLLEMFGAMIDDAVLREKQHDGYRVKFYAQSGREKIITITPEQISAQLARIEERFPKLARAGSS